jgi:hypothetical protein
MELSPFLYWSYLPFYIGVKNNNNKKKGGNSNEKREITPM